MKTLAKIIGAMLWIGSGLVMFFYYLAAMTKWMGFLGGVLAIFFAPGVILFPAIFWVVEGVFPTFYFVLMGIAIIGLVVFTVFSDN